MCVCYYEHEVKCVSLFCFVCFFQIWFYTNEIFRNAGIPDPYIQYTTVGTGAIEVISGTLGVSFTEHEGISGLFFSSWYF